MPRRPLKPKRFRSKSNEPARTDFTYRNDPLFIRLGPIVAKMDRQKLDAAEGALFERLTLAMGHIMKGTLSPVQRTHWEHWLDHQSRD